MSFVRYDGRYFQFKTIHATGSLSCQRVACASLTQLGSLVVAGLPNVPPPTETAETEIHRLNRSSPLQLIRFLAHRAQVNGLHLIGVTSYEAAHIHEDLPYPEEVFFEFHIAELEEVIEPKISAHKPTFTLTKDTSSEFYAAMDKAKEHLRAGDIFEIVLSRKFLFEASSDPRPYLAQELLKTNAMNTFSIDFPSLTIIGASPEILVQVKGDKVLSKPISGSLRRLQIGGPLSLQEEQALQELMNSEKEKSELDMLIDLARHDLHRVCNEVTVSSYREPLILERVVHTQACVTGILKPAFEPLDAFFSCLNAGTLVGAPKRSAMKIIQNIEGTPRNFYGGQLLHIFPDGSLRASILIRSAFVTADSVKVQAGATVLLDSEPRFEYWECGAKAKALLSLLDHEHLAFDQGPEPGFVPSARPIIPHQHFCGPFIKTTKFHKLHLLLVDNEDSFTFNLASLFESLGCRLTVKRNHHHLPREHSYDGVVLSPGPGAPADAGQLFQIIQTCLGKTPIFGVCLGFQALVQVLGGSLGRMVYPLHGKARAANFIKPSRFLQGVPDGFFAARYHSLRAFSLPPELQVTVEDEEGVPLAIESIVPDWPSVLGLQFHPESFLTGEYGVTIAKNWLESL